MLPELIVKIMIYSHAALGGMALLSGLVAIIARKGNKTHRSWGKIFFYSMLSAAALALVIAVWPNHQSPFLFAIGIFTIYLLIGGYNGLKYKRGIVNLKADKAVSYGMIIMGVAMILYPLIKFKSINIVLTVFGCIGIILAAGDLRAFSNPEKLRVNWQKLHLQKMTGAYIASVTAFLVVNQALPGLLGWLLPTVTGSAYITFWVNKVNKRAV